MQLSKLEAARLVKELAKNALNKENRKRKMEIEKETKPVKKLAVTSTVTLTSLAMENSSKGYVNTPEDPTLLAFAQMEKQEEERRNKEVQEAVSSIVQIAGSEIPSSLVIDDHRNLDKFLHDGQAELAMLRDVDLDYSLLISEDSDIGESASRMALPKPDSNLPSYREMTTNDVNIMMDILSDATRVKLPLKVGHTLQVLAPYFLDCNPSELLLAIKVLIGTMRLTMSRSKAQMMEDKINQSRSKDALPGPTDPFSTYVERDIDRAHVSDVDLFLRVNPPNPTVEMMAGGMIEPVIDKYGNLVVSKPTKVIPLEQISTISSKLS